MREQNGFLSPEQAHPLTVHGVNRNEDGTYSWKFDNYVRVFYPQRYDAGEIRELWGRIVCPTLLVHGTESWAGDPEIDDRTASFSDVRVAGIEGAAHGVHHDRLDAFIGVVRDFLSD